MNKNRILSLIILLFLSTASSAFAGSEANTNTFYGLNAGAANTGLYNTFIGNDAGLANTSGRTNTFLGYETGEANTTGSSNSFIGFRAGNKNTTGSSNTFVGYRAGRFNIGGNLNNCIGNWACYALSTGSANTVFGLQAGYNIAAGNYNTFIGPFAGYGNRTSFNTYIGYNTGGKTTTGINNLAIGRTAGGGLNTDTNVTTSNLNTSIGHYAGGRNATGGLNTAIGYFTGYKNNDGIGNIFLGYRAGYNETTSNKLYIDNSNTAAPLIYGDFNQKIININGKLGIAISAPAYPIQAASGAYVSAGGVWTNASSREFKDNIKVLSRQQAFSTLDGLTPVTYVYKADRSRQHLGFIAEDVPELVATKDRKGLSAMDVAAVLTKVVKEQQALIDENEKIITANSVKIAELERLLSIQ